MRPFRFSDLSRILDDVSEQGYQFLRCIDYYHFKRNLPPKAVVLRIDIDFSIQKVEPILEILNKLKIKASFFVRLHAREYNVFEYTNFSILQKIIRSGHELGYHSEIMDVALFLNEPPEIILRRDLKILDTAFDITIHGVASHNGLTGTNNLDFWTNHNPQDFGILYEAYQNDSLFSLFNDSLYISDSEWTQWKAYRNGKLLVGDTRDPSHFACFDQFPLIYILIHGDTFFTIHPYESP